MFSKHTTQSPVPRRLPPYSRPLDCRYFIIGRGIAAHKSTLRICRHGRGHPLSAMSRKATTKGRKSRQHGDAAAQAINDETYYVLRVNLTGAPVVPFPFSKDLFLKVSSSFSSAIAICAARAGKQSAAREGQASEQLCSEQPAARGRRFLLSRRGSPITLQPASRLRCTVMLAAFAGANVRTHNSAGAQRAG